MNLALIESLTRMIRVGLAPLQGEFIKFLDMAYTGPCSLNKGDLTTFPLRRFSISFFLTIK
jgi:hypothetical protein